MCIMNYLNPILIYITVGLFATVCELLIILMMQFFLKKIILWNCYDGSHAKLDSVVVCNEFFVMKFI